MYEAAVDTPTLAEEIGEYWEGRAQTYSNGVEGELADNRKNLWKASLEEAASEILREARLEGRTPRACDLGCGPGFFSILLAEMGFDVEAVDGSSSMIEHARENADNALVGDRVSFHISDLASLPHSDESFDLCVSRNVTWLMREPEAAYAEWLRVLKPGGKLVAYDANWYLYLFDEEIKAQRTYDMENNVLEGWEEGVKATAAQERHCEELAMELPLSSIVRPAWDMEALNGLGVSWCRADEEAWKKVWTPNEQAFYRATPTFMVEAVK